MRSRVDAVGRDVPASDIAPDSDDSEEPLQLKGTIGQYRKT